MIIIKDERTICGCCRSSLATRELVKAERDGGGGVWFTYYCDGCYASYWAASERKKWKASFVPVKHD